MYLYSLHSILVFLFLFSLFITTQPDYLICEKQCSKDAGPRTCSTADPPVNRRSHNKDLVHQTTASRRILSLLAHVLHSPTHSLTSFLVSFHLASQHPRIAHTTQCLLISGNCPSATYLHTTALQQAPKRCSTALRALPSNGLWCIWLVRRGRE